MSCHWQNEGFDDHIQQPVLHGMYWYVLQLVQQDFTGLETRNHLCKKSVTVTFYHRRPALLGSYNVTLSLDMYR